VESLFSTLKGAGEGLAFMGGLIILAFIVTEVFRRGERKSKHQDGDARGRRQVEKVLRSSVMAPEQPISLK
jgi:hypothetical protein